MKSVGYKNIVELRKSFCLTQKEMSFFIGISVRNYREKECGKIPFSQIEIMRMILIFDLSADDVYRLFYLKGITTSFWKKSLIEDNKELMMQLLKSKQK